MSRHHPIQTGQSHDAEWLITAIERILRPVVRLLVGRISCNAFTNLVRQLYVEEGRQHLNETDPDRRVTKSALALLTGLDTRAISHLEDATQDYSIVDLSPEAAVLGVWADDQTYLDRDSGEPMKLPIYGRGLTFQTLVTRTVGRNVTCPTVLEKLTESGNVEVVDDNYVVLRNKFYVPVRGSERTVLEAGSFAMNRLASALNHNLDHADSDSSEDRWLQQDRWTKRLPPERLEQFRTDIRELIERHIKEAEQAMEPHESPVRTSEHYSAGVGWYYWEKPNGNNQ